MKADGGGIASAGATRRQRSEAKKQDTLRLQQEASRKEEELQEQLLRDKHRFLIDRLRADIRYFIHSMQEFTELPPELHARSWEQCIGDMLKDMDSQEGVTSGTKDANASSGDGGACLALEPIVALLNYRDRVLGCILTGILYQKAILAEDCQLYPAEPSSPRLPQPTKRPSILHQGLGGGAEARPQSEGNVPQAPEGPMAELAELVRSLKARSDNGNVPEKYVLKDLPNAGEPGYFTYEKKQQKDGAEQSEVPGSAGGDAPGNVAIEKSAFQTRMLVMLREFEALDRNLRQMKFGKKVSITASAVTSKTIPSEEIRKQIANVFDRCSRLEHELQMSKAQQHAALDVQVELNNRKCEEADKEIKKNRELVLKREEIVQTLKAESATIRREKAELAEKHQVMAGEHLPVLDKIDKELGDLRDCMDQLTADAEMLSQMFRLQVQDSKKNTQERDTIAKELASLNSTLRRERLKNQLKDIELGKKETLHQRTIEARQATLDTYTAGKTLIQEAEERMKKKDAEWEETQRQVSRKEEEINQLKEEMRRATISLDELEQQKKECMKEFKAATGRPYAMLLEQYKIKPRPASTDGERSASANG